MKCSCNAKTVVLESRREKDTVRRRRKCLNCGFRFTTYEIKAVVFKKLKKQESERKERQGII